jgi:hypothetical protein
MLFMKSMCVLHVHIKEKQAYKDFENGMAVAVVSQSQHSPKSLISYSTLS